jgi:hypothetical protein
VAVGCRGVAVARRLAEPSSRGPHIIGLLLLVRHNGLLVCRGHVLLAFGLRRLLQMGICGCVCGGGGLLLHVLPLASASLVFVRNTGGCRCALDNCCWQQSWTRGSSGCCSDSQRLAGRHAHGAAGASTTPVAKKHPSYRHPVIPVPSLLQVGMCCRRLHCGWQQRHLRALLLRLLLWGVVIKLVECGARQDLHPYERL